MLLGLHHVTAFAGDPQQNFDYYTRVLGLRLIKRTVNFDDPATHHFYFASAPAPGAIATFFPWPTAPAGCEGSGQVPAIAFAVPQNAFDHWTDGSHERRFNQAMVTLRDPAGLAIELIASEPPSSGHAIGRLHSVTLRVNDPDRSAEFLIDALGFRFLAREKDRNRLELGDAYVDVVATPAPRVKLSAGMVHHVAWRVSGESEQETFREKLKISGVRVTRVIDRKYFRSIYFREPGGVLFEIATDQPGFTVDEPPHQLGHALQLPRWLEPVRESIERRLPHVDVADYSSKDGHHTA